MSQKYNFDEVINRKGTGALKVDALKERYGREDLIPLWVADMDFRTPDFIMEAIRTRCKHEILGYPVVPDEFVPSIINWVKRRHNWKIKTEELSFVPGVVKGFAFAIMNFSEPGDKIIIQPPVYHPFRLVPQMQNRSVLFNPLKEKNGFYTMDFEHLKSILDEKCKILILSNPHNPVGITWDKETLAELAEICYDNHILVISDEIHSDMAIFGNRFIPFVTVSEKARENSITLMAPSKTFNMAGIVSSFAVVPNEKIRKSYFNFLKSCELNDGHIFAYVATQAAYDNGDEWLGQMLEYIEKNIFFVDEYLKKNIPQIKAIIPQASFLIWLDCRELNLSQQELKALFVNKAGLALNSGDMFGSEGAGFMRMNVGCPVKVIEQALENLKGSICNFL
ncbi:MAG: PatB family C-S lyase [Candidatus Azobacteroides sp.]|nr:PatB family C-S lyase [Candidatus Azobacteroides sp.]